MEKFEANNNEWKRRETARLRKFAALERAKNMEFRKLEGFEQKELNLLEMAQTTIMTRKSLRDMTDQINTKKTDNESMAALKLS